MGDSPTALAHAEEVLRRNPNDPLGYRVYLGISLAHITEENWLALRETAWKTRAFHNSVSIFRLNELVAEMALGNVDRGRELARIQMSREPDFNIAMFRQMRARIRITQREIYGTYCEMMATAGIPETRAGAD